VSKSSGDGGEAAKRQKLSDELEAARQRIREWRDGLLQKPLLSASKGLSYPKEMEVGGRLAVCLVFKLICKQQAGPLMMSSPDVGRAAEGGRLRPLEVWPAARPEEEDLPGERWRIGQRDIEINIYMYLHIYM